MGGVWVVGVGCLGWRAVGKWVVAGTVGMWIPVGEMVMGWWVVAGAVGELALGGWVGVEKSDLIILGI